MSVAKPNESAETSVSPESLVSSESGIGTEPDKAARSLRPPIRSGQPQRTHAASGRTELVGYVPGAFDLFHIGHLNMLRRVRLECDYLIAGVVSDEVAVQQKGRLPVVPQEERLEVVGSLDVVDEAAMEWTTDKLATWERVRFDVVYKGSDWEGSQKWTALEREFASRGVRVVYLPYTEHVSTTVLRTHLPPAEPGSTSGS